MGGSGGRNGPLYVHKLMHPSISLLLPYNLTMVVCFAVSWLLLVVS